MLGALFPVDLILDAFILWLPILMLLYYAGGAFALFTLDTFILNLVNPLVQAQGIPKLIPHRDYF